MDEFLDRLAGSWSLTGKMGSTELHQKVEAGWALQGRFLQMHYTQEDDPPPGRTPYEAIYMLGYDEPSGVYSFHLFDTFGAGYARTVGVGSRQGDSLEFIFDYPEGPFSNKFTWEPESGEWEMLLHRRDDTGSWQVFATKHLARA